MGATPKKHVCKTFFEWIFYHIGWDDVDEVGCLNNSTTLPNYWKMMNWLKPEATKNWSLILKGNISQSPSSVKPEVYTTVLSSLVQPHFSMAMLFGIIGISILLVGSPFVFAFKQDALKQMTPEVGKGLEFRESFRQFVSERKLFHPFFLRYILMCLYLYKSKYIYCI